MDEGTLASQYQVLEELGSKEVDTLMAFFQGKHN